MVRLLLLTGCRKGEILALKWSEVDGGMLRLAEGKTGPRTVWLAESYRPGVLVSVVVRRNDVNANLVFTWRRRFRQQGGFVPVVVGPDRMLPPPKDAGADASAAGRMKIALSDGSRVIVDREVDGSALGRVLSARRNRVYERWPLRRLKRETAPLWRNRPPHRIGQGLQQRCRLAGPVGSWLSSCP